MHISSGRWMYGLLLALITSVLWGILPIKLKEVLQVMDPVTVTWYRLAVAGSLLFAYLAASRRLPRFRPLGRKGGWLLALAIGGLTANYVLYLVGLNLLSPGTTQLVIQVAPILLLISSLFVFRERFSLGQAIGLMVMLLGFGLFFNQRLGELLTSLTAYTTGVLVILLVMAATSSNAAIRRLKSQGGAVIIMAHRPAAIAECELLLVMEGGMRRAFGPRDEVLRSTVRNAETITRARGAGGGVT